ncbi:unnamed protein product [Polarella glacialis]|uniref:PAP-associated domain-containing protein n=1 Tax=Polarella glacialis TaxID=89957 RepID=A0A813FY53_POLGL|nr:unnamed protein product [Polarella glacialis]
MQGTSFAAAMPEVDIIVSIDQDMLVAWQLGKPRGLDSPAPASEEAGAFPEGVDAKKMQKSAIRSFTDRLVSQGGFKFRRSAFRGQEPKVTLLAPMVSGVFDQPILFDFSVNSTTPLYSAALLAECCRMDVRAHELIILVRRWAKNRGICHVAKGHLSPYAWSVLVVYFLQVAACPDKAEGQLLPALQDVQLSSLLLAPDFAGVSASATDKTKICAEPTLSQSGLTSELEASEGRPETQSVAELMRDLLHFYAHEFQWGEEGVSLRRGSRGPPRTSPPREVWVNESTGRTESVVAGPYIEDPFEPRRNLGECMTAPSLARLQEELARAAELCVGKAASLERLLEPWAPPERSGAGLDEPLQQVQAQ